MQNSAQYQRVTNTAAATIKAAPAFLCGVIATSGTPTVTIYDNTSATGTALLVTAALTVGQSVLLPVPVQANIGLHVVVSGTGAANILFK